MVMQRYHDNVGKMDVVAKLTMLLQFILGLRIGLFCIFITFGLLQEKMNPTSELV